MILVDTAVWADYFNGRDDLHAERLESALADEASLAVHPIIVTEVLQGFRSEKDFAEARGVLTGLRILELSIDGHIAAAALFRRLRRRGITIRGAVDCIIAQTCLEFGAELLSPDADFRRIAQHTKLKLCKV